MSRERSEAILRLEEVRAGYGRAPVLGGLTLEVGRGEIVGMVGPNGAGKTTTLRTILGMLRPESGSVWFEGRQIDGLPVERIVRSGIAIVPEGRRIFPGLTVYENLEVAGRHKGPLFREKLSEVLSLFPRLSERLDQRGWSLSGGEQQMLAIGRALVAEPKLLLMDEPSLGLAPNLVQELFQKIVEINRGGTTVFLVEQNAFMALQVADRAFVLEGGQVVLGGPARELAANPRVKEAYVGA